MKKYIRRVTEGVEMFECEGRYIPNDTSNRHYRKMLEELEAGEANQEDFIEPTPPPETDEDRVTLTRRERRFLRRLMAQSQT